LILFDNVIENVEKVFDYMHIIVVMTSVL